MRWTFFFCNRYKLGFQSKRPRTRPFNATRTTRAFCQTVAWIEIIINRYIRWPRTGTAVTVWPEDVRRAAGRRFCRQKSNSAHRTTVTCVPINKFLLINLFLILFYTRFKRNIYRQTYKQFVWKKNYHFLIHAIF